MAAVVCSPGNTRDVKRNEVEWSALEFRRGAQSAMFRGVVFQGESKARSLRDRASAFGSLMGLMERERSGAEINP